MKNVITIEYCTSWGYLGRAVAHTRSILNEHSNKINEVSIVPSSGGVYEISFNDELIFSKKELDRYPERDEIEELVRTRIE